MISAGQTINPSAAFACAGALAGALTQSCTSLEAGCPISTEGSTYCDVPDGETLASIEPRSLDMPATVFRAPHAASTMEGAVVVSVEAPVTTALAAYENIEGIDPSVLEALIETSKSEGLIIGGKHSEQRDQKNLRFPTKSFNCHFD